MAYTKEQRLKKLEAEKQVAASLEVKNEEVMPTELKTPKTSIKNIPLTSNIIVLSNCYGQLIYKSKKTGFETEWDDFKSWQPITLEELITMRNTYRKFFEKNWIVIEGFADKLYKEMFSVEEILDFLQVKQFYKESLCPPDLDDVFKMSPEEIEKRVPNMSSGVKNSIIIRANELIENRELDSLKVITTLEKILNCELSRPE